MRQQDNKTTRQQDNKTTRQQDYLNLIHPATLSVEKKKYYFELRYLNEYYFIINKFLKPKIDQYKIKSVLDCGCGVGFWSLYFKKLNLEIFGIDNSKEKIDLARLNLNLEKNCEKFIVGDCNKLPYSDSSFDLTFSFDTIEMLNIPVAIYEMIRVTKSNGLIFIKMGNPNNIFERILHFDYPVIYLFKKLLGKSKIQSKKYQLVDVLSLLDSNVKVISIENYGVSDFSGIIVSQIERFKSIKNILFRIAVIVHYMFYKLNILPVPKTLAIRHYILLQKK